MDKQPLALLFDIDGTLIDSAGAGGRALLMALGNEFNVPETRPVPLHGRTDLGIMTELLESHGVAATPDTVLQLCEHYFRLLPVELQRQGGHVLPGVRELLDAIENFADEQLKVEMVSGVLTGNMPASAQVKLQHFGLEDYFEFGVYGDRVHHRPLLRDVAIQAVYARCGPIPTQRMVIIGDTPLDVALAKAMGSPCLAVCTGGIAAQALADAGADRVVDDLSQTDRILDWLLAL